MLRLVLLLSCWRMHARGVWQKGNDRAGVQYGGAIAVLDSSNRADLGSCILSSNQAEQVRRHAAQEQCMKHLCMLQLVLQRRCWRMHARGVWEKGA